jgi:hypothetical protein
MITPELLDKLLANYENPEALTGDDALGGRAVRRAAPGQDLAFGMLSPERQPEQSSRHSDPV